MHIWNLLIQTSIPRPCYDAKDLFTVSLCFGDFEKARDKMRSILCELPTQNNAMFDGKGRIKFFNEYVERLASETEGTNEGSQEARLTKKNLTDIQESLLSIFSWRDTVPPLKEGIRYSDGTLTAKVCRGRLTLRADNEARLEGIDPLLMTNCFSTEKEQDYYLHINGRFIPGLDASAFLSVDLRKKEVK